MALMLTATLGSASEPDFGSGGFVFSARYGPGYWSFSPSALVSQVPDHEADVRAFVGDLQVSHAAALRAQYTILGHVSLGADLTASGWNIAQPSMGGAGFLTGFVGWHPFELLFALLEKRPRPVPLDLHTTFGVGYGLAGQRRGMDGLLFEWGLGLDYFATRYFAVGAFVRGVFFAWEKLYLNYFERAVPGNTVLLPGGSGGSFWTFGLSLSFRAGD